MEVFVKCFSSLAGAADCAYDQATPRSIPDGGSVRELLQEMNVPESEVKIVFVNGRKAGTETDLAAGDRVALAPPTFGM